MLCQSRSQTAPLVPLVRVCWCLCPDPLRRPQRGHVPQPGVPRMAKALQTQRCLPLLGAGAGQWPPNSPGTGDCDAPRRLWGRPRCLSLLSLTPSNLGFSLVVRYGITFYISCKDVTFVSNCRKSQKDNNNKKFTYISRPMCLPLTEPLKGSPEANAGPLRHREFFTNS